MPTIDILIEGRADFSKEVWFDYCSTTLISTSHGKKILVDPGSHRSLLLQKLNERNIIVDDIDYVFLTHSHLDHSLLAGIFTKAIVVNGSQWWKCGIEIHNHDGSFFGKDINIVKTYGHSHNDSYLLINTEDLKVCVAGDLFWWDISEVQEKLPKKITTHPDRFAINKRQLQMVRKIILEAVDYVVPGHGKPFIIHK